MTPRPRPHGYTTLGPAEGGRPAALRRRGRVWASCASAGCRSLRLAPLAGRRTAAAGPACLTTRATPGEALGALL